MNVLRELEVDGFSWLRSALSLTETHGLAAELTMQLREASASEASVLRSRGETYGSRNLQCLLPQLKAYLNRSPLESILRALLGEEAAVVRILFFDKPPGRSWSVPWHQDRTIAVQDNKLPSQHFCKPTIKAGMAHVEAPTWLLQRMITLRLHLDAMTSDNGPLIVVPGSHHALQESEVQNPEATRADSVNAANPTELHAAEGDLLLMRPLLSHSSRVSTPKTTQHRRVIHIELSGCERLPDGYLWQTFERLF